MIKLLEIDYPNLLNIVPVSYLSGCVHVFN